MGKIVLSFDCGTQSVRAMLFDEKGGLLAKEKVKFTPYFSVEEGFAEQNPDLYWEKMGEASLALKKKNAAIWDNIVAVAVTTMRDVGICVDKEMNVLRPAILWMDRRKSAAKDKVALSTRLLFTVSGMSEVVRKKRADCKSNWIRENQPEIWQKTHKFLQLSTYINYKMTGEIRDSLASCIGHIPVNYKKGEWFPDNHYMAPMFRIENSKLFPMITPCEIIGAVTKEASLHTGIKEGLPLVASGGDKGCETVGSGAIYNNTASLSFGTTATIQFTTPKYVEPLPFMPAYPAVYPKRYNPEIMVYRGYWMLTWFIEQFVKKGADDTECYEKILDEQLKDVPPCCGGLYVEPFWGPGIKSPEARGAMIGFTETHTLIHMYRAIIEGINFELLASMKTLEKRAKTKIERIKVSGGGGSSDTVCQITADMFGLPVERVQTFETSGLGAAACAFVGAGTYKNMDEAIQNMVRIGKTFTPNPENARIYQEFFNTVYCKTYKKLRPLYTTIKKMSKKGGK